VLQCALDAENLCSKRAQSLPLCQVSKLFSKITELLEEPDVLVFVLIDEIESLASARKVRIHVKYNSCIAEHQA